MKIIVHGAAGRMGNEVVRLISAENSKNEIAVKVDAFGTGDILTSLDEFDGYAQLSRHDLMTIGYCSPHFSSSLSRAISPASFVTAPYTGFRSFINSF